ncbi:MAG: hypothetical protein ACK5O2_08810 [Microthrixaceae bacterium]
MAVSEKICGRCGHDFCSDCVVYPFGESKAPLCVSCALEAGGVSRQHTGRPRLAPREIKRRLSSTATETEVPDEEPEPTTSASKTELDQAWLNGEVDAESSGGWSRTF